MRWQQAQKEWNLLKKTIGLSSRISNISMLGKSIEEGSKKKNDIQKDLFKKYKGDPKVIVNEQ